MNKVDFFSTPMEEIKKGKFVSMTYQLFIQNDEQTGEELFEEADKKNPMQFVCGEGEMLEAFESNLEGKKVGDKVDFTIPKEKAYGERNEENVQSISKKVFEVDGKFDGEMVYVGNILPMLDDQGNRFQGLVLAVDDKNVQMDFNHPLAGEDLHFKGEILEVREATEKDKHHCCGCEDCHGEGGCEGGCGGCH